MLNLFEFARRNNILISIEYKEGYDHFRVIMSKGECNRMVMIKESDYCRSKVNGDDLVEMILKEGLLRLVTDFEAHERRMEKLESSRTTSIPSLVNFWNNHFE